MARLFGNKLALDHSFRPLIGKNILDSTIAGGVFSGGWLFYLLEDELVSNDFANGYAGQIATGVTGNINIEGKKVRENFYHCP